MVVAGSASLVQFGNTTSLSCTKTFPSTLISSTSQHRSLLPLSVPKNMSQSQLLSLNSTNGSPLAVPSFGNYHQIDEKVLQDIVYDALVFATLNGLLVGDKSIERSGRVPGIGLVHLPFSLLPPPLPETHWKQACDLAPLFNELVDRVSLDGNFLQQSLSRTKEADEFTCRLLDIHSKMLEINKKEEIRLGLFRSDYMLDEKTKSLLQIEMNTISTSFSGVGCVMTELHRNILSHYGKLLGLDSKRVPVNTADSRYAEALAKAWSEYNNPSAVIIVVVQAEERNMYDQHFVSAILRERYPFLNSSNYSIRGKHYFFLLYSKANSLICIIRTIKCDIQGFRVIILNFMTRIILQPYGKRWQKLIKKEKFCRMEHFL
jgi:glutathione synthase